MKFATQISPLKCENRSGITKDEQYCQVPQTSKLIITKQEKLHMLVYSLV